MKYAMLVYSTPGSHDLPEEEFAAVMRDYEALRDVPGFVASAQLHQPEMATTLRAGDGGMLTTDGPFADTKEVFGGYYVFDVDDLDTALGIARRIPALRLGGWSRCVRWSAGLTPDRGRLPGRVGADRRLPDRAPR